MAGAAYARSPDPVLILNDTDIIADLTAYAYVTEDALGELSAQDIVQRFRNNIRGTRNMRDHVMFDMPVTPHWVAFGVRNNTKNAEWMLDLGRVTQGRAGVITKLLVYEGGTRDIFFDGLSQNTTDDHRRMIDSAIPVRLRPGVESILVLYVMAGDSGPLALKPSLGSVDAYLSSRAHNHDDTVFYLVAGIALVSAVLLFFGYIYTHSLGFLPFVVYYMTLGAWFVWVDFPAFPVISGVDILSSVIILLQAVLILLGCFLTIPPRNDMAGFRMVTVFMIGLAVLAVITLIVAVPFGSAIRFFVAQSVAALSVLVGLAYMFANKTPHNRVPIYYLAGWIVLAVFANILQHLCFSSVLPYRWEWAYAPYLAAIPQSILVFMGVISAIDGEHKRAVTDVMKRAQKAQTLLKAKQSKEASDQSRLLRVIEREREIMEELRGREAERTEEMRKAKIMADEANNAKSAFLAVVSHEIRTPMTGIMGMLRLLEDTNLSGEQRDFTRTIKDSGDAMLALLNDILDFSKIEGGGMDLEVIACDLRRILNGVQMLMKGHADQKAIALELEIDPDIPPVLMGDPTRIRQIFLNLVGNALKFTTRGHVKMIAHLDRENAAHDPDNGRYALYYAVEDTGIGISEDAQKNLFKPFSQADSSIARKYGGTGLGLAICKRLVEAMGSTIQIFSREGKGTRFHFTVIMDGRMSANQEEHETRREEHGNILPKHILVVDDNAINRKVVAGLLSRDGHSYDTASTGQEVFDKLDENPSYDAVLLDIELPDMNGMDVARTLRADPRFAGITLIALTGNVQADDIAAYQDAGMAGHIAKPIDPDALRRILAALGDETPAATMLANGDDEDSFGVAIAKIDAMEKVERTSSSSAQTVVSLLDESMLKGLKDGLGAGQTKELIIGLFEKTREILPQMAEAYAKGDKESLRARAHELKGMAGNFGLSGLSAKAAMIERVCRSDSGKLEDTKEYLELLESTAERSRAAVDKYLDS